ncbi:uncharacterized protein, partial [Venturia canescens]|uniref:uncharacterized protein n=1 Tax=Venturia canescens TaxID=32260 RepID=UPI001C9C3669
YGYSRSNRTVLKERKAGRSSFAGARREKFQIDRGKEEGKINESLDIVYVIEGTVKRKSRDSKSSPRSRHGWSSRSDWAVLKGPPKGPKGRSKKKNEGGEEEEEVEELANQECLRCRRGRRGDRCSKPYRGGFAGAVGGCGGFRVGASTNTSGRCNDELLFVDHPHHHHHHQQQHQPGSTMEMIPNVRGKEETSSSNLRRSPWSIHIRKGRHSPLPNITTKRKTLRHHRRPFLQFQ